MNIILSIFVAILAIFSLKRKNAPRANGLGNKRFLIAIVCASFFYIDRIFSLMGTSYELAYQNNFLWSLILLPFYAGLLTFGFKYVLKDKAELKYLAPSVLGTMLIVILFNLTSNHGIALFSPISNYKFTLHLLHDFNTLLFFIGLAGSILIFVLKNHRRDIARAFLAAFTIYIIAVGSFTFKAKSFANEYIKALNIKATETYIIAQPLSVFNWRIMIATEDNKIHDSFITLKSKQDKFETDTRTNRVAQLYKPKEKAVWRIYRKANPNYLSHHKTVMKNFGDKKVLEQTLKFSILKDAINYKQYRCLRYKDLRTEGVRKSLKGNLLFCQNPRTKDVKVMSGTKSGYEEISLIF